MLLRVDIKVSMISSLSLHGKDDGDDLPSLVFFFTHVRWATSISLQVKKDLQVTSYKKATITYK